MTDYLVIDGVNPYNGRYEFEFDGRFSTREWGWIKRLSGYHPLTLDEAYRTYDPEFWSVFALIMLRRAGKLETHQLPSLFERFADEDFLSVIRLELGETEPVEGDADPSANSNGNTGSSGPGSSKSSESSGSHPNHIGMPGSVTSESAPPTLVS